MDDSKRLAKKAWLSPTVWLLLVVVLAATFACHFSETWLRWFPAWRDAKLSLYDRLVEGESYYTHGPLIPLVSLLIAVLLIRKTKIEYRPRPLAGGLLLAASLVFHVAACFARVNFASGFALIGVLAGLVLMLWGYPALRRLAFPLAFLLFMVPVPEVTIARLNFRLKMLATEVGVFLANFVGVITEQDGNRVHFVDGGQLVIANVCNGLRTLISLLAFGALYAYVCKLKGLWRLLLFGLAVPVALVSNSLRVLSLIVVADVWSPEVATGWYHEFSGVLIYVMAFLLMFGIERLILWARRFVGRPAKVTALFEEVRRGDQDDDQWSLMSRGVGSRAGVVAVVLLAAFGGLGYHYATSAPAGTRAEDIAEALPRELHVDNVKWNGRDRKLSERVLLILERPAYLNREYAAGERRVAVSVVFSRQNRKGTHPPDYCLEGSGEGIVGQADLATDGIPGHGTVPCREILVQTGPIRRYHLYTYKCGPSYTNSFWVQQLRIVVNGLLSRDASGALIQVSTPITSTVADARRTSMLFLREAIPHLDEKLK